MYIYLPRHCLVTDNMRSVRILTGQVVGGIMADREGKMAVAGGKGDLYQRGRVR